MPAHRKLAAIMFTDIVGYTAIMGNDETLGLEVLQKNREIHKPLIEQYNGEWLKEMGDGILASFASTSDALSCAIDMMKTARDQNIELRIGIHIGEVVFEQGDVFGDGVNIASRVEALAVPGSVLFTDRIIHDIRNKPQFSAVPLGSYALKNVTDPISVFALSNEGLVVPKPDQISGKLVRTAGKGLSKKIPWKSLAGIIAILLLFIFLGYRYILNQPASISSNMDNGLTSLGPVTLAALPFSNISEESNIDFLGFALVDQVINSLSYLQNVVIRPSSSIRKYSNVVVDPVEIGDVLSVQFVLMGHYVKHEDSVRLNLELIDIGENKVLWRGSVQEQMADVFKLQDLVANSVIDGLKIQFSQEERNKMVKDVPQDPLAYEYYLKALSYPYGVEGNALAIQMLEESIALDSEFAPSYSELGYRIHLAGRYTVRQDQAGEIEKALDAFAKALELNSELLTALGNLSLLKTEMNEKDEAIGLARRMVQINPNNALAHFALGYVYRYAGMLDEAVREMEIAVRLDPKNTQFRSIGLTYNLAGRYDDAIAALTYEDGSGLTESWLGMIYIKLGEYEKAREMFSKAIQIDSAGMLGIWAAGLRASIDGNTEDWVTRIREVEEAVGDPEAIYFWGLLNILLGDYSGGLHMFNKAVDMGFYPYPSFQINPILDPLRDNPEFLRFMQKAKTQHEAFKERHF